MKTLQAIYLWALSQFITILLQGQKPLVRGSKMHSLQENVTGKYKRKRIFAEDARLLRVSQQGGQVTGFPEQEFVPLVFTRKLLKHFIGNVHFFPERRLQIIMSYTKILSYTRFGATSLLQQPACLKVMAMGIHVTLLRIGSCIAEGGSECGFCSQMDLGVQP